MKFKDYKKKYPCLYKVLCKMFEIAWYSKEVCEEVDWSKEDWFMDYTRTDDQQQEFVDWLTQLFYADTRCRKELTTIGVKNKMLAERAAEWFNFNYGLKLKRK